MITATEIHSRLEELIKKYCITVKFDLYNLPEKERAELLVNSKIIKIKKKTVLYNEGDPVQAVYILKSGIVKTYQTNLDGNKQILYFYKSGELFGYRPLFGDALQYESVAAIEDCELLKLDKNIFFEEVNRSLSFCKQLLDCFSNEFLVFTNRLNMCSQVGKRERLAMSLLLLNGIFRKDHHDDPAIPNEIILTRTNLANFVGTSLENLIRMLNVLKGKKLIRVSGKSIFILDFEGLMNILHEN